MDTRDGRIYDEEEMKKMFGGALSLEETLFGRFATPKTATQAQANELQFFRRMELEPTEKQLARKPPKVGRNESCPCGSGKKFKKCCLIKNWQERYGK